MNYTELVGSAAGFLTTLAFLPQVIRTWKTRSTKDISLAMFAIFCTGVLLWCIYGFLLESLPIMITNVVTLLLSGIILFLKLKHIKDE